MDRILRTIVGHLKHDESDRPWSPFAHSARREQRQNRTGAATDSRGAPKSNTPWSSVPASPGVTNLCDYLDQS